MDRQKTCKQCGRKLIQKATKQSAAQLKKPYYYTAYYWCPHCNKLYHDEKFKVVNIASAALFTSDVIPDLPRPAEAFGEVGIRNPENVDSRLRGNDRKQYDVQIWTDGACTNNGYPNARAAWSFVSGKTERAGLVEGKQTNNIAEALAIYNALLWAVEKQYKKIKIYSDSQISINNVKKSPELIKANREIFQKIARVIKTFDLAVDFEKVLGHSGDENNERADKLANNLATGK